jgi:hypothetical protein
MAGLPCVAGCTCGRHRNGPKPCPPGCRCYKHFRTEAQRAAFSELQRELWSQPEYRVKMAVAQKGHVPSEETRRKYSEAAMGHEVTEETRQKLRDFHRGRFRGGEPAVGFVIWEGYRILTGQQDHPLAQKDGQLAEHRKVLYDKIGPGPHACHWGCGKRLEWGGWDGIHADHLDEDRLNNSPENLVPSCLKCNWDRSKWWFPTRSGD